MAKDQPMTAVDALCEALKYARENPIDCVVIVMRRREAADDHHTLAFITSSKGHDPDVPVGMLAGAQHRLLADRTGTVFWEDLADEEDERDEGGGSDEGGHA